MDLQTREDSHNPFVMVFGLLALVASIMGVVLLFRRRRSRVAA
ncbi:LPXTG cell wall anchor domain-containing protein [Tsuneonella aeria]|nr:LPXTG cell wall anchor domain-containing protein [Tsuneonella aeria]